MINELRRNADVQKFFGISLAPLHRGIERSYFQGTVDPFCKERRQLAKTMAYSSGITYATRIDSRYAGRSFSVVFFDVAGETFYGLDSARAASVVAGASGYIFVVDPVSAVPALVPPGKNRWPAPSGFTAPIDVLREYRRGPKDPFVPVPATIVLTKADLICDSDSLARRWLESQDLLKPQTLSEESEDVYSLLAGRDAKQWLYPAESFMDVSLHFASASGVDVLDSGYFPADGFGQRRVLRPLLSLFAMLGIVDRNLFLA
ncbi:hypothetical protein [Paractinoplanes maris]|uniref:hypothetical protein n=1 Tax=Paractinoplanes maris TaxID=1734446 RepID=UPI002020FC02|nr:hypothetical protein [Actinoplanes maris]